MQHRVLLTGATGYVGGCLLRQLEEAGHAVHCLTRNPDRIADTAQNTAVFRGDIMDPETLPPAFKGVDTAYYMIHSLADSSKTFADHELQAAENFVQAAKAAGIGRIIYLGGLGNEEDTLSDHLKSRHAVGRLLRESGIQTIEFRASIVLGAGSYSFEMIRSLTEHLPFMIMPKWVSVKAQPIGIEDLLTYLMRALDIPLEGSQVFEIGGADQVSYRDLMCEYARQCDLRRLMIPVPVLTPKLSSYWLGLVTPLKVSIGAKLIEGVRNPTVVEDHRAEKLFDIHPQPTTHAIAAALLNGHPLTPKTVGAAT